MGGLRTGLALLLVLHYVFTFPTSSQGTHSDQVHDHPDPHVQDGAPVLVHEVDSPQKHHHTDGDGHLNNEVVLTEPDHQVEDYDTQYYEEEEESPKTKRTGMVHHMHAHKNHTAPKHQKRETKSSEEDFEPLSADHVPHKRSTSTKQEGHEGSEKRRKRSHDQGIDEDGADGSFDGLEYEEEKNKEREKREMPKMDKPGFPEETAEVEEMPQFPSDMHRVDSVALRVKRVNKAGSSHRNRLINKNKSNTRAGQTDEQPSSDVAV